VTALSKRLTEQEGAEEDTNSQEKKIAFLHLDITSLKMFSS
jgi:hypothetical protein